MDSLAIDYQKLLKEERRKARQQRFNPKQRPSNEETIHRSEDGETNQPTAIEVDRRDNLRGTPSAVPVYKPRNLPPWPYPPQDCQWTTTFQPTRHLICSNPARIYYIPNAISRACQNDLCQWLRELPEGESGMYEWKTMTYGKRRVCMWPELHPTMNDDAFPSSPCHSPLDDMAMELGRQGIGCPTTDSSNPGSSSSSSSSSQALPFNHVLLNDYQAHEGILPHTDGPSYASCTATISLQSPVLLHFTKRRRSPDEEESMQQQNHSVNNNYDDSDLPLQVVLEPGSVIIFQDDAYLGYCHGISESETGTETTTDHCLNAPSGKTIHRGHRYSLTFRHKYTKS